MSSLAEVTSEIFALADNFKDYIYNYKQMPFERVLSQKPASHAEKELQMCTFKPELN